MTLANRDPIFLELYPDYERSEGMMTTANGVAIIDRYMTKIETVARGMNKYEVPIRNASLVDSKTLQVQANAFYGVTATPASSPAPAPTPAPAAKNATLAAAGEKGKLVCNVKDCLEMVAKEQCEKYAVLLKTFPTCPPPVCIGCWQEMMNGKGVFGDFRRLRRRWRCSLGNNISVTPTSWTRWQRCSRARSKWCSRSSRSSRGV
jgi:hypothetical protein